MEERNLRPRPKPAVRERHQAATAHRRYKNKDEETDVDSSALFIFQTLVSIGIIITALFVSNMNSEITNDIAVKIKYALSKHTTIDNVNERVNSIKDKFDNIHPTVLEIFGFKNENTVDENIEQRGLDDEIKKDEIKITDEIQGGEAIVDQDILEQLDVNYTSDEEKKLVLPEEIVVFPEEEL